MLKFLDHGAAALSLVSPTQSLAQIGDVIFRVPPRHDTPSCCRSLVVVGLIAAVGPRARAPVRGVEVVA